MIHEAVHIVLYNHKIQVNVTLRVYTLAPRNGDQLDSKKWEMVTWFKGSLTWGWLLSGGNSSSRRHRPISPPGRWAGTHSPAYSSLPQKKVRF